LALQEWDKIQTDSITFCSTTATPDTAVN
jgi:hypothetical protein